MDSTEPLSELADIHLPAEIGFWPPAPGWWLLLALLTGALIWLSIILLKQWRRQRLCHFAVAELEKCFKQYANTSSTGDTEQESAAKLDFINGVNAVLRRVALKHFPENTVAGLTGQQWVAFIRDNGSANLLDDELAIALAQGRFARHCDVDVEKLHAMAQQWIKDLYLTRTKRQSPSTSVPEHA